jgi:hypothetical protein
LATVPYQDAGDPAFIKNIMLSGHDCIICFRIADLGPIIKKFDVDLPDEPKDMYHKVFVVTYLVDTATGTWRKSSEGAYN